jgi:hypothetical protein
MDSKAIHPKKWSGVIGSHLEKVLYLLLVELVVLLLTQNN